MLQLREGAVASDLIRDSVAQVFSAGVYYRPLRRSLLQYIGGIWNRIVRAFLGTFEVMPFVKWAVVGLLLALAISVTARAIVLRRTRAGKHEQTGAGALDKLLNPWDAAKSYAAAGRHIEAVHALYLALLDSIATTDRISLDPAKTVGDYRRELRSAASARLPLFSEFALAYEPIVWGSLYCDRERYDTLEAIVRRSA